VRKVIKGITAGHTSVSVTGGKAKNLLETVLLFNFDCELIRG